MDIDEEYRMDLVSVFIMVRSDSRDVDNQDWGRQPGERSLDGVMIAGAYYHPIRYDHVSHATIRMSDKVAG